MTGRQKWQTLAAVAAVVLAAVAHALMSPPPSPPLIDAMVLATVALCAYTTVGATLHNRQIRQEEAAERQAAARRAAAVRTAADMVITGRPERDYPAVTCTPAAVARYAATMGVAGVTLEEAESALRDRLTYRGFTPGPESESEGRN